MALFGGSSGDCGQPAMPKAMLGRECKPDYEAIIGSERLKKEAARTLMAAIEHYLAVNGIGSYSRDQGPIPASAAIGTLYLEIQDHDKVIAELIKRQEEDK
jgi:hypothetical protein